MIDMIDTLPPQNIEAEMFILGGIILEPDSLLTTTDIIAPEDFYKNAHRVIYSAMLDCYELGEELSFIGIKRVLSAHGTLEAAGGISYISSLINSVPTAANVKYHCKIVHEAALLRRTAAWAATVQQECYAPPDGGVPAILERAEKALTEIASNISEKRSPETIDHWREIETEWEQERAKCMPINLLDTYIRGACPGHKWLIVGYTSYGKSALLHEFIVDFLNKGLRVLVFKLEDDRKGTQKRIAANIANVPLSYIVNNSFGCYDQEIRQAIKHLKTQPLWVYDNVFRLGDILLKSKKHKLKNQIDVVCVDYIQLVRTAASVSDYSRIRTAITDLCQMAADLEVLLVVLSQVDRQAARSEDKDIIGAKGAGELEEAPDLILKLSKEKKKQSRSSAIIDDDDGGHDRILTVHKNRQYGPRGDILIRFSDHWDRIERRAQ